MGSFKVRDSEGGWVDEKYRSPTTAEKLAQVAREQIKSGMRNVHPAAPIPRSVSEELIDHPEDL